MNAHRLFIATFAVALVPFLLAAQDEEESLYIPPVLIIRNHHADDATALIREYFDQSHDESLPLLPIIFFDHPGDWSIPPRYSLTTDAQTYADTVDQWPQIEESGKYHELLDIIGYRMSRFPDATVTLRPGYSAEPAESSEVATTRAHVVRDYLTGTWEIDSTRIVIAPPERFSTDNDILPRHEEARRVVIESDSWELLQPVDYTVRQRGSYRLFLNFLIRPNLPDDQVAAIDIVMTSYDTTVGRGGLPGHPGMALYEVNGAWTCYGCDPRTADRPIIVEAIVTTHDGHVRRSNRVMIAARARVIPPNPQRYRTKLRLPFFDYRDSTLTDDHRRMLREIIDSIGPTHRAIVQMTSMVEFSEDETVSREEREARHQMWLAAQALDEMSEPHSISQGTLDMTHPTWSVTHDEDDGGSEFDDFIFFDDDMVVDDFAFLEWGEPDLVRERAPHPRYALPRARMAAATEYLQDSLGITIVNESWKGEQRLQRIWNVSGYYPIRPEDRWYARIVEIGISNEDGIREHGGEFERSVENDEGDIPDPAE